MLLLPWGPRPSAAEPPPSPPVRPPSWPRRRRSAGVAAIVSAERQHHPARHALDRLHRPFLLVALVLVSRRQPEGEPREHPARVPRRAASPRLRHSRSRAARRRRSSRPPRRSKPRRSTPELLPLVPPSPVAATPPGSTGPTRAAAGAAARRCRSAAAAAAAAASRPRARRTRDGAHRADLLVDEVRVGRAAAARRVDGHGVRHAGDRVRLDLHTPLAVRVLVVREARDGVGGRGRRARAREVRPLRDDLRRGSPC